MKGSFLVEVRSFQEHYHVSNYLSRHGSNMLWWIGATDSPPEASEEGKFVWLSDKLEIKSFSVNHNIDNRTLDYHDSKTKRISLWGPGQPDNWPNQVNVY